MNDKHKRTVEVHSSQGDTYLELTIRAYTKEAAKICDDLHSVQRYVENAIAMIHPTNHVNPAHAFRAILNDDCKRLEVWHYNVKGDRDRLIITVKD